MTFSLKSKLLVSLLALNLAACASALPKSEPSFTTPHAWQTTYATHERVELSQWWLAFESPQLTYWVQKAIAHNNDLKQADANLVAARALLAQAKTTAQPAGSLDASPQRLRQAGGSQPPGLVGPESFGDQSLADIGLNFGWEIDLSGRLDAMRVQASAQEQATMWRKRQIQAAITAQTVSAWLSWRTGLVDTALITKKLKALEAVHQAQIKARQLGGASGDAAALASAEVDALRAELIKTEANIRQAARRLAVLTGDTPQSAELRENEAGEGQNWRAPDALPELDPSQSLRLRPDVGLAEQEVRAALAQSKISRADLYPRISLLGSLGLTNDPSGLGRDNSLRFSAGPQLSWGVFNFDRTRAQIGTADAKAEAAYIGWHQTTLSALEEAENAIDVWVSAAKAERAARGALGANQKLLDFARQRYQRGMISKLELSKVEIAQIDAERQVTQAHFETALNWSRACLALGGGWQAPSANGPA